MKMPLFLTLQRLLFPQRCARCGRRGSALCARCFGALRPAQQLAETADFAALDYGDDTVHDAVWSLKYSHRAACMKALVHYSIPAISEYLAERLQSTKLETLLLIPVPQYQTRTQTRGYNQSELIARWIAAELPTATVRALLRKEQPTQPQARLSRTRRLVNLRETMTATEVLDPQAIYIIVDDVTTTGATFTEARRALRAGGAKKILAVALAHGYAKK